MPLHFTLLFPWGTKGWDQYLRQVAGDRRVTPREFFSFYINVRDKGSDYLFQTGRLFQEFLCMAWVTTESQRLSFQRQNQKELRCDTYKNVKEVVNARQVEGDGLYQDDHEKKIGRKVLTSTYIGSPRWYNAQFQDGMAICREYHKPDLFVTMTTNPHWSEITSQLNGAKVQDRPDLVSRVFKMKKDRLIADIRSGEIFGVVPAKLEVIEFQKRGLPHLHVLVILEDKDRLKTAEDVDSTICAEIPPEPTEDMTEEAQDQLRRLRAIVATNMIHGPCGKENPKCPCMVDGVCSKNYPKPLCAQTVVDPDSSYPQYRRKDPEHGGRTMVIQRGNKTYTVDNRSVVPYSPFLSLRYNCHINVESCSSAVAAKYLYKYVMKGHD